MVFEMTMKDAKKSDEELGQIPRIKAVKKRRAIVYLIGLGVVLIGLSIIVKKINLYSLTVVSALYLFMISLVNYYKKFKYFREIKKSAYIGTHEIDITKEGVFDKMKTSTISFNWDEVKEIQETNSNVYFFSMKNEYILLPKRVIRKEELPEFIDLANKYLKEAEKKEKKQNKDKK